MQPYADAPPPYPGTTGPVQGATANVITSKGSYHSVPVYEIEPNNVSAYVPTTYPLPVYPPSAPMVATTIGTSLGYNPMNCLCPNCNRQVVTRVSYESGALAWLLCLLLCIFGCIPCCIIPFCVSSIQDAIHTCPNCSHFIGRRKCL